MIAALAKFPIPEEEKLHILLLPKTVKYEWGPTQNELVVDKLLHIFYAVNESDQLDVKSVSKLIHQYLKDADGVLSHSPNKYVNEFCPKFFMHLVKKLPSVDNDDDEIEYILEKKCSCYYGIRGYAILALRAGSIDPEILADASAKGSQLLQCLMLDSVQSDKQCSFVLRILRKLIRLNVIQLDYADIARFLGTICKNLVEEYCYDKHIRALCFVEELVYCGLDIYSFMQTMEPKDVHGPNPRFHMLLFKLLLSHFKGDCVLMRMSLHWMWRHKFDKREYLLNYGWDHTPNVVLTDYGWIKVKPKRIPFAAPSSLMQICRNKIYVTQRENMLIGDYWRFVEMLHCPQTVKAYLKFWPDAFTGKAIFACNDFAVKPIFRNGIL
jgi:hypothetical protein